MLLPTKGLSAERALISLAPRIAGQMSHPMTTSQLWESFQTEENVRSPRGRITFDWFALGLTTLFAIGVVEFDARGRLRRTDVPA